MSDETRQPIKTFSWNTVGILFSAAAVVVLLVVGGLAYGRLAAIDMNLASQLDGLQHQLSSSQDAVQKSTQQLDDALKSHQQTINELYQVARGSKDKWAVTEAYYLVRLANDNLQFTHNVALALKLLQNANQEISSVSDPGLATVRKALAADMAALQSMPSIDIKAIYTRLTTLNHQVDQLPLLDAQSGVAKVLTQEEIDPMLPWWKREGLKVWQFLQKIVIVRHQQNALPLVTPSQRVFIYQNLHAMIMQSLWALLHHEPDIYQSSLQQATSWIKQYVSDSNLTATVLNELSQLQAMDIQPAVVQLDRSLQAFADYKPT